MSTGNQRSHAKSEVVLWSNSATPMSLRFSNGKKMRRGFECAVELTIEGDAFNVELDMINPYASRMLEFFEDMGASAAGWDGVRSWTSEFSEMGIEAENDGKLATMKVVLVPVGGDWDQHASLTVRATELVRLADEMREFMQLDRFQ